MKVKRLTLEDVKKAYPCMHDLPPQFAFWETFVPESQQCLKAGLGKHVEGYHLFDGENVVGHIYYSPSEKALAPFKTEPGVAFIYCVWLGQKYRGKGHGRELFDAFKEEMRKRGYKGILVSATDFPEYMHQSHFEKQGFKVVMEYSPSMRLMYFPITKKTVEVTPMELKYKPTTKKVEVTLFKNFFCPVGVSMHYKVMEVAKTFGDKVKIVEIEATEETLEKYGAVDGILINGKRKIMGPVSEEEIRKAIQEEIT